MNVSKGRLWNWVAVLAYVVLIYSTLSVAPKASKVLSGLLGRHYNLFVNIFIMSAVLTLPFIAYKKLKSKSPAIYIGIAAVLSIYAFVLFRWTNIPAEKIHLVEYGFLSLLLVRALRDVRPKFTRYTCVILGVAVIGCLDEVIQYFLPNRVYDIKDAALNVISGILGLLIIEILS